MKKKKWINIQKNDKYINLKKKKNIISRSWFKLKEINKEFNIIKKKNNIIDLGCSPGGWTQFLIQKNNKISKIFSCDINPINKKLKTNFILGDICKKKIFNKIIKKTIKYKIHNILSDISPNITGIKEIDNPKFKIIIKKILYLCKKKLKKKEI